jgi:outer membrane protein TolC
MRFLTEGLLVVSCVGVCIGGCTSRKPVSSIAERPNVTPTTQPGTTDTVKLDKSLIRPMHREMLPIDLAAAIRVALARNLDIQQAQQFVEAQRGRLESTVGAVFPAVGPQTTFEHVDGTVRESNGALFGANFSTFRTSAAVELITNPGRVIYEIIAARKTLSASEDQERFVVLETLRLTANQYYDLALAQADVAATRQAVLEAEELLRINLLRLRAGTGVPADVALAEAQLAERRGQFIAAIDNFYRASVALAVTLRLDASVTLVPQADKLSAVTLVRPDLPLDDLLALAVAYRPDLDRVRVLVEAAAALSGATWWGDFGPQFQVGYEYGGITGHSSHTDPGKGISPNLIVNPLSSTGSFAPNPVINGVIKEAVTEGSLKLSPRRDQTFAFTGQERFGANAGARWSLSAIGDLRTANAQERSAMLDAELRLDQVKGQVVSILQESRTQFELIGASQREVAFATEALRLTQVNLRAGTMITLDVLQAEDAVARARIHYATAVARYNQAQVNLIAAIGLLEPETFAAR